MMYDNEPQFIKYEEILLPDEETTSSISKEDDAEASSDSESEDDDAMAVDDSFLSTSSELEQPNRAEKIRAETIGRILDAILEPKKIQKDGKTYLLRLSRQPTTRDNVIELSQKFEKVLKERQVRMKGYCPIRRELYDLLFDELIRESTIHCPERGSLLLRVRDEFRVTLDSHERLFESGVAYGGRKALEGEVERRGVEIQYERLKAEAESAEKRVSDLQGQMEAEETESRRRMEAREVEHGERMEFLRKLNKQLKSQRKTKEDMTSKTVWVILVVIFLTYTEAEAGILNSEWKAKIKNKWHDLKDFARNPIKTTQALLQTPDSNSETRKL